MRERFDLTGVSFGRWTVVRRADHTNIHKQRLWVCRCACGRESLITSGALRNGMSKSCGCLRNDTTRIRSTKHGLVDSGAYRSWCAAKGRCFNPNNPYAACYSERGLTMDPRWRDDFMAFYADMGPRPKGMSLDRRDNAGPYSPENCQWAPPLVQANNKRNNLLLEWRGQTKPIAQWSAELGLSKGAVYQRIHTKGWTIERAFTQPVRYQPRRSATMSAHD